MIRNILLGVLLAAGLPALAQDEYPNKPVKVIVGYAPGGGTDVLARLAAKELSDRLGKSFVVENRPGALAIAGTEAVAKSAPDGYTLLATPSGPMTMNPVLRATLPYSPSKDFAPISIMGRLPFMLVVNGSLAVKNVKELIEYAKAKPNEVTYASSAAPFQLATELFKQKTGTAFLHVPYKSSGDSTAALLGGQVTMTIADLPPLAGHIKAGKLRALAYTDARRSATFPEVPTMAEAGLEGMEIYTWVGLAAPAGTPAPIVRKLRELLVAMAKSPDMKEKFLTIGVEPMGTTEEEFARVIRADTERWAAVARNAGIKPE